MTSHELAKILLAGPDHMVTVRGYEGGVNEITTVCPPQLLRLHVNNEWYYGKHEYHHNDSHWDCTFFGHQTHAVAIHIG